MKGADKRSKDEEGGIKGKKTGGKWPSVQTGASNNKMVSRLPSNLSTPHSIISMVKYDNHSILTPFIEAGIND